MYSVIIQNKRTADSFFEHNPIFLESLNLGKIGYCRWIESGTTVDTAVPELREMTKGKKEWRAIIVRVQDEDGMRSFVSDPENPYDFLVNSVKNDNSADGLESDIPLIRLTHILGGIPAPEIRFKPNVYEEEHKIPYTYYSVEKDEEAMEQYKLLKKKYEYDGRKPSEIWLVTFHRKEKLDESVMLQRAWTERDEMNSSEFWRRNRYPSACRFMVYNYSSMGPVQKKADLFNFWLSVLLLSVNHIDPSTLQGYRLYRLETEIDTGLLENSIQANLSRMDRIKRFVKNKIKAITDGRKSAPSKRRFDKLIHVEDDEKIRIDISGTVGTGTGIDPNAFRLYAKTEREEMEHWRENNTKAKEEILSLVKNAERQLNMSIKTLRLKSSVDKAEVLPLDSFEREDFEDVLSKYYDDILQKQKNLPDTTVYETEEEKIQAEKITDMIKTRISSDRALNIAVNLDISILVSSMPMLIYYILHKNWTCSLNTFFISLCVMLCVMLAMLFALIINKYRMRNKIREYNDLLNQRLGKIKGNEKEYEDFVNDILFYSKGRDYLRVLSRKTNEEEDILSLLEKQLKAADRFENQMKKWGEAYVVDVRRSETDDDELFVDASTTPLRNNAYSLELGGEYEIPLNSSCGKVVSPFEFAKRLVIIREELFDDAEVTD